MKTKILILIFALAGVTAMHTAQAQTYDPLAVQRINDLITNNGLWTYHNEPGRWQWMGLTTWNNETPKQIVELRLAYNPSRNPFAIMTGASSFAGLTTLKKLNLDDNWLAEIDVTNCAQLQILSCMNDRKLKKLDLAGCIELQSLNCRGGALFNLDLTTLDKLTEFDGSGQRPYLVLYKNEAGEYTYPVSLNSPVFANSAISYSEGVLKSTDKTVQEVEFSVQTNKEGFELTGIMQLVYSEQALIYDLLAVQRINDIVAGYNGLQAVLRAPETWEFVTWNDETPKKIIALELPDANWAGNVSFAGLTTLQTLNFNGNRLTGIDLTNCTELQRLMCAGNSLSNLDLANLDKLTEFDGSGQNGIIIDLIEGEYFYNSLYIHLCDFFYSCDIIYLNNPVFANNAISYSRGIFTSTDWTVCNTDFSVQTNKEGFELTGNIMFRYLEPLGIDSQKSMQLKIYPNPTTGELKIESGELKIEHIDVYDVAGRKQLSTFNSQLSTEIDISHLSAGIYFVKVMTEQGEITKKIIKR